MNGSLEQIEQVLKDELEPLEAEAAQLDSRLSAVREQAARIQAAIAALHGGKRKSRPHNNRKSCATKTEVLDLVVGVLKQRHSLPIHELESEVKRQLTEERGKSLSGFGLRFREVLNAAEIEVRDEVCRLREPATKTAEISPE